MAHLYIDFFPINRPALPQEELDQRPDPPGGVPGEPAGPETRVPGPRTLVPVHPGSVTTTLSPLSTFLNFASVRY